MNVKEARQMFIKAWMPDDVSPRYQPFLLSHADAYALAAHVDACGARQNTDEGWRRGSACGDGWLCDVAKELGK